MTSPAEAVTLDPEKFRRVLGHYPTGVVVVTGIVDGLPIGMVVGSFTSVSLTPPLVAYLPSSSSRTYTKLKTAASFCVNVLSADQVELCREITARGSSGLTVKWRPAGSGAPILEDVVAWIDCEPAGVMEAGDHLIVLGRVLDMDTAREVLPLLFFQGGYGKFAPGSMITPASSLPLVHTVRVAAEFSDRMQEFATRIGCELTVIAPDGEESVFIASTTAPGVVGAGRLGARMPIGAPIEALFVSEHGPVTPERWVANVGGDPVARQNALLLLDRIRDRGWSLTVAAGEGIPDVDGAVADYSSGPRTPARDRIFLGKLTSMSLEREPEAIDPDTTYQVMKIAAPVRLPDGGTGMVLKLSRFSSPMPGREILHWVDELAGLAEELAAALQSATAPSEEN